MSHSRTLEDCTISQGARRARNALIFRSRFAFTWDAWRVQSRALAAPENNTCSKSTSKGGSSDPEMTDFDANAGERERSCERNDGREERPRIRPDLSRCLMRHSPTAPVKLNFRRHSAGYTLAPHHLPLVTCPCSTSSNNASIVHLQNACCHSCSYPSQGLVTSSDNKP